jgi:phosphatidylserine/phosphatidylglycerophosphate/cardiolipin synthase-like enzyme
MQPGEILQRSRPDRRKLNDGDGRQSHERETGKLCGRGAGFPFSMDFVRQHCPMNLALVAGKGHYPSVVQAAMNAERSVWIATANLKELMVEDEHARPGRRRTAGHVGTYRSVLEVFEELVGRGVEIRILHASPPSRPFRADLRRLPGLRRPTRGIFELRLCPRVHFKAVIVDGTMIYLGSANWTGAGLGAKGEGRRNFELGFCSRDDLLLDEVQAYFDRIWQGSPCTACKLKDVCPKPLAP